MFTGIIHQVARVASVGSSSDGLRLEIALPAGAEAVPSEGRLAASSNALEGLRPHGPFADVQVGESIAVNGVCLTVDRIETLGGGSLFFDAVRETLERTTLRELATGTAVNLERALRVDDLLGGHFVQGHVDGIGMIAAVTPVGAGKELEISVPKELAQQVIMKGSVAVDGVSLTVAGLSQTSFRVALVPHTLEATTLGSLWPGRKVNIETDLLGKWVLRAIETRVSRDGLSLEKLRELGF